ncbi:MAG: hypothetical protein AB7K24_07345 [Gemmataceae bacterium]
MSAPVLLAEPIASRPCRAIDWPALDAQAWKATRHWEKGILQRCPGEKWRTLAELSRSFLWDKVARALRRSCIPASWEPRANDPIEGQAIYQQWNVQHPLPRQTLWRRTRRYCRQALERVAARFRRRTVFVPVWCDRLGRTVAELLDRGNVEVATASPVSPIDPRVRRCFITRRAIPDLAGDAHELLVAVKQGLADFGVALLEEDEAALGLQLHQLLAAAFRVEEEFRDVRPDLVLTHADNHPPPQIYVSHARRLGIRTVMLQHGLDCEQFCLSEAFADVLLTWGPARQRRYCAEASVDPARVHVIGNPEWDERRPDQQIGRGGQRWLWTTRPHVARKCYVPSDTPQDGIEVLGGLLCALREQPHANLVIKPHPFDYLLPYQDLLATVDEPLRQRVRIITDRTVLALLAECDLLISEDSSALLEGAIAGKPMVYVLPRRRPGTFPELSRGGALTCTHPDQLPGLLSQARCLDSVARGRLTAYLRSFIDDHAGPLDGQAARRAATIIEKLLPR